MNQPPSQPELRAIHMITNLTPRSAIQSEPDQRDAEIKRLKEELVECHLALAPLATIADLTDRVPDWSGIWGAPDDSFTLTVADCRRARALNHGVAVGEHAATIADLTYLLQFVNESADAEKIELIVPMGKFKWTGNQAVNMGLILSDIRAQRLARR